MKINTPAIGQLIPLQDVELAHIAAVIEQTKTLDEAATILEIDIATLYRKRKRHGFAMHPAFGRHQS